MAGEETTAMTNAIVANRQALRLSLLKYWYRRAEGRTNVSMDLTSTFNDLAVDEADGMAATRWLIDEGLVRFRGTERVSLEHYGVEEAEAAEQAPDQPTAHFEVPTIQ